MEVTLVKATRGKYIDLTGKVFGRLTVLHRVEKYRTTWKWACKCTCGKEICVLSSKLKAGQTSCGCYTAELASLRLKGKRLGAKKYGVAAKNYVLHTYKKSAQARNIDFTLSDDEFFALVAMPCVYCNRSGTRRATHNNRKNKFNGAFYCTGLDRIDNSVGYTTGNVEPCCWDCNNAKKTMGKEEFVYWIRLVYTTLEKNGNYTN